MQQVLRILMLEDDNRDVTLIEQALRQGGLGCHLESVRTKPEFVAALQSYPPDVILSDHGLPQFDGFAALARAREDCPETPFIFVTGELGEAFAIESFEQGAADYVLKSRLSNLVPAIQRAVRQAEDRHHRREAEADRERLIRELQAALARVQTLSSLLPICASCKKIRDEAGAWWTVEQYLEARTGTTFTHGVCPECAETLFPEAVKVVR
ncbi:MAG: response regulator [Verrucomicrobia bacterium]|nr:response regulator [Verrucomicrobiota bacterium]